MFSKGCLPRLKVTQTSGYVGESQELHVDVAHPVRPCLALPVCLDVQVMEAVSVQLFGERQQMFLLLVQGVDMNVRN